MHKYSNSRKEEIRKEYNIIRYSNSSLKHEKIKSNVKSALKILLDKYHTEEKYIGIYWPLKGEVDIRFIKETNKQKIALPSSSKVKGISYHHWSNNQLEVDSNKIPAPSREKAINPNDISILFVPAIAIDQEGYRLGYGGGLYLTNRGPTCAHGARYGSEPSEICGASAFRPLSGHIYA